MLFRKHPFISDTSPQTGERILDVSGFPDGTELLLAADVLVTDYSSLLVDFAPTGLPLLCFGYDLEVGRRSEERPKSVAEVGVIVGYENADEFHG